MADPTTEPAEGIEPHEQGEELVVPSCSDDEERLADPPEDSDEPEDEEHRRRGVPDSREDPRGESPHDPDHPQYHLEDPREAIELAQDNFRREGLR